MAIEIVDLPIKKMDKMVDLSTVMGQFARYM